MLNPKTGSPINYSLIDTARDKQPMKIYSWSLKLKEKLSERNNLFKLIEAKILPAHLLRHNTPRHGYTLATHKRAGQNIHKVFLFA